MPPNDPGFVCILAALALLGASVLLLALSARLGRRHGLPAGKVVYSDTGAEQVPSRALYSRRYGLAGKPDYLLATEGGLVPVELKPERTDPEPVESHLLQVLAYCLLVEETEGRPPPYGLLRYRDDTFKVDYNAETRLYIEGVIEDMREARKQTEVHRSHEQPPRCRGCGYREICEESLWPER
jgi:CRISPR-associated exonuclease Cas4